MSTPLLRLDGVRAGYRHPVVGPLSLRLARGERLGVVGGNGSGKSTLLRAIVGQARLFEGSLQRPPESRLAYLPQRPPRPAELPLSGHELLTALGAQGGEAPPRLRPWLDQRVDRLSGGQWQLLSLWARLAGGADLVLLDEPSNNLDSHAGALLAELLLSGAEGRALLLVSHDRPLLDAVCSDIVEVTP